MADDDWITAVSTAPAMRPKIGFENMVRIPVNSGTSANGFTASLMVSIPNIKTAKPIMIVPMSFFRSFFENIMKMMPMTARIGENDDGFKS